VIPENQNNKKNIKDYISEHFYLVIILIFLLIIIVLCLLVWFKIWAKNKYIILKYRREKVENSKNMYIARCEESPNQVYIIEEKSGKKFYNHIKNQYTRGELNFSHSDTSGNDIAVFSKKDSDYLNGKFKTIEIINLEEKIRKDLEIIHRFIKLFKKLNNQNN